MKNLSYLLPCLLLIACSAKPKENADTPALAGTTTVQQNPRPFDLARLILKEDLMQLMAEQSLKSEAKDPSNTTLSGFEVFKSKSPKVLRFKDTDFSGLNNYVLFHYQGQQKTLAGYELFIDGQQKNAVLISLLKSVATPIFKHTGPGNGAIEIDENGNEVKQSDSKGKTFQVWENKKTGLSYFLSTTGDAANMVSQLIVLNSTTQFGKDWMSSQALDWHKNTKSEPF
jgi:hypothetical protein